MRAPALPLAMAFFLFSWSAPGSAATVTWINPAGGTWTVGSNWSSGAAPTLVDDVVIDLPGTYTVTVDVVARVASVTLGSGSGTQTLSVPANQAIVVNGPGASSVSGGGILSLVGGSLAGAGTITVSSTINWSAGGIVNALHAGTMNIAAGGALNLMGAGGAANKKLEGWTINNAGTITSSGDENITINNGLTINNLSGGRYLITNNPSYNYGGLGPVPQLNNSGTLTKTSPGSFLLRRFDFELNNDGTVELPAGAAFSLTGGGTSKGLYNLNGGMGLGAKTGTIGFASKTYTFSPGASINGTASLGIGNGALVNVEGAWNLPMVHVSTDGSLTLGGTVTNLQRITLSGGRLDLNTPASVQWIDMIGGTFGGSGALTVPRNGALTLPFNGSINWSGGAFDGVGSILIPAGSTLNIQGAGTKSISQRTIDNAGTITSSGTGAISIGNGATINNQAGGKYVIQTDAPYDYGSGAIPHFNNSGTLTKIGGTATAPFGFALTNSGTISLQTGVLAVSHGYTQTGDPSTLNLTIAGLTPGTQFAKLAVTGAAALAGTLTISTEVYVPNNGDTFQIMTFDSRSGDFTTKNYTYPGGVFTDSYGAGTLTLTAHTAGAQPPAVSSFTASPPTITAGDSTTLSWATTNAVSANIDNGVGAEAINGSVNVSPATTTTYTLTANAPNGSATATVTVTVNPRDTVPPTSSASSMPAPNSAGWNNSSVTVALTATDNPGGSGVASLTYTIDAGAPTTVSGATATLVLPAEGMYSIAYHATDKAGNVEADHTLVLRIDTTAPSLTLPAAITADATSPAGVVVRYTATATDNAASAPPLACAPSSGSTFPIGTTTVRCTATDAAGNSSSGSFAVTVNGPSAQTSSLISLLQSFNLPKGISNSLTGKLQKALDAFNAGDAATGCSILDAFRNEVQAQSGKKLTVAQADQLIAGANQIKAAQGCP